MLEFTIPTNSYEAMYLLMDMRNVVVQVQGTADIRPDEVVGLIGDNHMIYTKGYAQRAQRVDGMWVGVDFTKGSFFVEELTTGKITPINNMVVGAIQLIEVLKSSK